MIYIQKLFIQNLRFFRSKLKISQIQLAEKLNISPNYLNAVENGKNFPSLDILQKIIDILGILPYQLFIEYPDMQNMANDEKSILFQELNYLQQRFNQEFEKIIQKYSNTDKEGALKSK